MSDGDTLFVVYIVFVLVWGCLMLVCARIDAENSERAMVELLQHLESPQHEYTESRLKQARNIAERLKEPRFTAPLAALRYMLEHRVDVEAATSEVKT